MAKALTIKIKETLKDLRALQKASAGNKHSRLQMLILTKEGNYKTKVELASALSVSPNTIQLWRNSYREGGVDQLLLENRGGKKQAQITPAVHQQIEKRLNNPKDGFKSFKQAQQWINETFDLNMQYHAVNKYLKRKFSVKPKVGRKSHINKDAAAIAVFKKPAREVDIYKK